MTEALATLFEGKTVTVTERDGDLWFPLADLAAAWGIDRKTPGNLVGRNQDLFAGMFLSDGDVTYHDVNERGLYLLMGKISADRLKNPEAKAAMIRFQRWVPELIQQYRKKEIVPAKKPDQELDEVVAYDLIEARQIAALTSTDPKAMQAAALRKLGYPELADVLSPPVVHGETGWYNPKQLGEMCGLTSEQINNWLHNNPKDTERRPFQYRDATTRLWRLTPFGMEHGREYMYTAPSMHQEVRIAWRVTVLYAAGLKHDIADDQMALPARA
jgi:prophage antirepressor-like protein